MPPKAAARPAAAAPRAAAAPAAVNIKNKILK